MDSGGLRREVRIRMESEIVAFEGRQGAGMTLSAVALAFMHYEEAKKKGKALLLAPDLSFSGKPYICFTEEEFLGECKRRLNDNDV